MTMNSSPPSRATVSSARTQLFSRCANDLQQPIADRVAQCVVDQLETIEIEQQQSNLVSASPLPFQGLVEVSPEQEPVGQFRQRVVMSEPGHFSSACLMTLMSERSRHN
jgi:hypothetical protein